MPQANPEAADAGNTRSALAYYNKAARVAPYLHETYLRIARLHAENDDLKRARRALRKARDQASAAADQRLYQAKLGALESL